MRSLISVVALFLPCVISTIGILLGEVVHIGAQPINNPKAQIVVGTNVQVSRAHPDLPHAEILAAADPNHPGRIVTCSMVFPRELARGNHLYCYTSFDNGASWEPTLKITEREMIGDPVVIYGRGDDVFVVCISHNTKVANIVVFKSGNAGRTWVEWSRFKATDRPFLAFDRTNGKFDGRMYIVGQLPTPSISGALTPHALQIFRSLDNGKTFLGPVTGISSEGMFFNGIEGSEVFSDGTLAVLFKTKNAYTSPDRYSLNILTSTDGGETISKAKRIAEYSTSFGGLGQLAVDPGSKAFKDRLYAAWVTNDSVGSGIWVSYSSDKGDNWSHPVCVNSDSPPPEKRSNSILPAIAVNKEGIVLITWYDRGESNNRIGWRVRASASLDGGETFGKSVAVSEIANEYSASSMWPVRGDARPDENNSSVSLAFILNSYVLLGADTTGIAATSDGIFHPTWFDRRTGTSQIWTASIKVNGQAVVNGGVDLAQLDDISNSIEVKYVSRPTFDRSSGTMSATIQLQNSSADTIYGPIKVRVLRINSAAGNPQITNSDNGETEAGAVWDFSSLLPGGRLLPNQVSDPKIITVKLSDMKKLGEDRAFMFQFLNLDMRVFGKRGKNKAKEQ